MRRIRNHVNPLKSNYALPSVGRVGLPGDGEVEVELGCADAQFLFRRAAADRARTCLGVEIREDLVEEVNQRAAAAGLPNLRAVFANVNADLDGLFPDGRVARFFLNFPDPWFKRRHRKRRVLTPEVVTVLHRQLATGGELLFQSDVWDLALDALAVLEMSGRLQNAVSPWSFLPGDHAFAARSLREERCIEKGARIWRLLFRRGLNG